MTIKVDRYDKNEYRTIGRINLPGFESYTLEDPERKEKIAHKTAIPIGTYEIVVSYSNRFKRMLSLLADVPGFTGVRIHSGNSVDDSSGCILIGLGRSFDTISQSRSAMGLFMAILMRYLKKEKVYIQIK